MKKIFQSSFRYSLVLAASAILLFSCGKKSEQVKLIPKDANLVLTFDTKSIAKKSLDFKEIFSLETIKKAFSSDDSTSVKIKNAGIDFTSNAYLFGQVNGDVNGYMAAVLPLSDASNFETFLKDVNTEFTIVEEGGFKIGTTKADKNSIFIWNENTAVFCGQSATETVNVKDRVLGFFNLKPEESLAENDNKFKELQSETADISFWMSFEKIAELASKYNPAAAGMNFKDTYMTAVCNFENGQVVVNSNYHANKELAEKLAIGKDNIEKSLIGAVPGKSVISLLSFSMNMEKLYAYLQKENLTASIDESAKMVDLNGKDLFTLFNGDFIGTINGIQQGGIPMPEYGIVAGIANKDLAAKALESLSTKQMLVKKEGYYSIMDQACLIDKGNYWIVVPESMRQDAMDSKGEKLNGDLSSLLSDNSSIMYFNFTQVPDAALDFFGASVKNFFKTTSLESITFSGTSIKENVSKGKIVVAFKEKDQNSLITLIKSSGDIATQFMPMASARNSQIEEETTDGVYEEDTLGGADVESEE